MSTGNAPSGKRMTAGILALIPLTGSLGIHKFYLGYTTPGIIQLLLGCCGVGGIIALIEGIIYLTKTDQEFDNTYVYNQKHWF
jgi:TM2 domain-containing membrane protein YozV